MKWLVVFWIKCGKVEEAWTRSKWGERNVFIIHWIGFRIRQWAFGLGEVKVGLRGI